RTLRASKGASERLVAQDFGPAIAGTDQRYKCVLERVYDIDDGRFIDPRGFSYKEIAAYQLGLLHKEARCHNRAVFWFRRSLSLARAAGADGNVGDNLHQLAWNLETLGSYGEAGPFYREMMDVLSALPPSERPLDFLVHASMFQLRHGDRARGE